MKKTMKQHSFASRLKSLALVFGIALAFASCANDDLAQNGSTPTNNQSLTTFSTGDPTTRTTMDEDGTFYWGAGDKIYVKDDYGNWNASSNAPTGKTATFKFMVPGTYIAHNSYEVYYPGRTGSNDQVTIPTTQTQIEPNSTALFGISGDCGMASATRIGTNNQFSFTLDHKAAYLRFLPRTGNSILQNCYLTKIEVSSDNDIAATYTLDKLTGKLQGTGSGKQIILTTRGVWGGAYQNGFPLTNNVTSASTNGAYMIIKPGTHSLRIRYWVRDNATNIEGTITKLLSSKTFDQNKYYDITANLDVRKYDGNHYYMWDAQDQYWAGYEWSNNLPTGQPTLAGNSSSNYAQNNSDSRFYNDYNNSGRFDATHTSFKDIPNANEVMWYAMAGDPRSDYEELWTTMGHLYRGGMWFLKHNKITNYSKNGYNGTDYRTTDGGYLRNNNLRQGLPSVANANDYFFLPFLGSYSSGQLSGLGSRGYYWSSSANPNAGVTSNMFSFDGMSVNVASGTNRSIGGIAQKDLFE